MNRVWFFGLITTLAAALAATLWLALERGDDRRDLSFARYKVRQNAATIAELADERAILTKNVRRYRQLDRKQRRALDDAQNRLSNLRSFYRWISPAAAAFAPARVDVGMVEVGRTADGTPAVLAVDWSTGPFPKPLGLAVWTNTDGSQWKLSYTIVADGLRVKLGSPGRELVDDATEPDLAPLSINFAVGDVTGDGMPDVLTFGWNSGSGYCGVWRVLQVRGSTVHEILRRETCETGMEIANGMLRTSASFQTPGCDYIHGCARRIERWRWTGSSWVQVSSRVVEDL